MGSLFSSVWDPTMGMLNLHGKVAVVTGANAGIGYVVTKELACHGAKVYLAARNKAKAQAAIKKLYLDNPIIEDGSLAWLPLDLADLDNVKNAAETLMKQEKRLDILVNNAGLATKSFETTSAGFDMVTGVNHLAHFLFTVNLLPLMKTTAAAKNSDVRVVTVSSRAHKMFVPSNIRFDTIDDLKYRGMTSSHDFSSLRDLLFRYAVSKLANILFCRELQRRLDAEGVPIISLTCDPGPTDTDGGMGVFPALLRPIMRMIAAPVAKGSLPILYLAGASDIRHSPVKYKAAYLNSSCKPDTPSALARDDQVAKNLWRTSEEALVDWIKV